MTMTMAADDDDDEVDGDGRRATMMATFVPKNKIRTGVRDTWHVRSKYYNHTYIYFGLVPID